MTGVSAHPKPLTKTKRGISRVARVNSIVSVREPSWLVLRRAEVMISLDLRSNRLTISFGEYLGSTSLMKAFFLRREDGINNLYPVIIRSTDRISEFASSLASQIILHWFWPFRRITRSLVI